MYQVAQIGAGLRLVRVRPELEGEVVAELRGILVQHEVGQQRLEARRVDGRHRPVAVGEVEFTQQADVQNFYHGYSLHAGGLLSAGHHLHYNPALAKWQALALSLFV